MVKFVGWPPSSIKQNLSVFDLLKKALTVLLFSFLLVIAGDTHSRAISASNNQNPPQFYPGEFSTSNPSYVDNSQHGNLFSLAARYGLATCWGSNGPTPIHVCLTDEMGIGYNSFYGFNASLNLVNRDDYGAIISADVNRLQFHGNGTGTETNLYRHFLLTIGDRLSGDNTTVIGSVTSDFHLGSGLTHLFKLFPRVQYVDYVQDMSLTNHTQHWADASTTSYSLVGIGGVIEFDHLPTWASPTANGIMGASFQDLSASATIGMGSRGSSYWSWNVWLKFLNYHNSDLKFTSLDIQISAEAGVSMWQILEPPPTEFNMDVGRVDSLMFSLQASAAF